MDADFSDSGASKTRAKLLHAVLVLCLGAAFAVLACLVRHGFDRYMEQRATQHAAQAKLHDESKLLEPLRRGERPPRPVNLERASLAGVHLEKIRLDWARLVRADLSGAYLRGANLEGALLWMADLRGADLRAANLRRASLQGAHLQRSILRDAQLNGSDLGVDQNGDSTDLRNADLRGANLHGAWLQHALLAGADLRNADLTVADLRGANLRSAHLQGARLDGARLRGADLSGATGMMPIAWQSIVSEPAIEGYVRNHRDEPASDALVTYGVPPRWQAGVRSDSAGHFALTDVPAGRWFLVVWHADTGGRISFPTTTVAIDRTALSEPLYLPDPRSSSEHVGVPIELRVAQHGCDEEQGVFVERSLPFELARGADGSIDQARAPSGFYEYSGLIGRALAKIDGTPVRTIEAAYELLDGEEGSRVLLEGCGSGRGNRHSVHRIRYRFPEIAPPQRGN